MTKIKYVAIEDAASILGICDGDLVKWIENENLKLGSCPRSRPAMTESSLKNYSNSKTYDNAIRKSILFEKGDKCRLQLDKDKHSKAIDRNIKTLHPYIDRLQRIHQYYLPQVNDCGYESREMAAYLLFSRVISTLKMCCLCAINRHWYWGSLLREIDEALDVALYFIILKETDHGKNEIRNWFRLNEAPKHSDCRKKISKHHTTVNSEYSEDDNKELMFELYHKKSKFTHPTYRVIREITELELSSESVELKKIDYGPCTYTYKILELVDFFRSSVLSACQYFLQCFYKLPLLNEHWLELRRMEKELFYCNFSIFQASS